MEKIKAKLEKKQDRIIFVASTDRKDRHGESIPQDTWDLRNFKKAPRLLADHEARVEKIVGKAKKVWLEGKKLLFEPVFHEITKLSRTVKQMVEEGVLDTVSVGFIEHLGDEGEVTRELLEISFVAIPANVDARQLKSFEREQIEDFVSPDPMRDIKKDILEVQKTVKGIESSIGSLSREPNRKVRKIKIITARRKVKRADAIIAKVNQSLRATLRNEEVFHE